MTADRCPTDTSISSCLGDGSPSGWIIVRGEIYTPGKWHLLAAPECLRRGAGLGDIARLQNDTVEALDGWRPLVLVGDPASEMHAGLSPGHLEAVALARQDQPVAASAVIRGVGQDGRDVLIYRAENTLISERTRGVEIVDCERDISLLNKWFIAVARRSQCARDLEAALLNLLEKPGVNTTTEFETHYGELCRTHANVDHYLSSGMVRLRQSKKIGVWLPILTECEEQCRRHVGLWDQQMARLMRWTLGPYPRTTLLRGTTLIARYPSGVCDRCGHELATENREFPLSRGELVVKECSVCASYDWVAGDDPSIHIELPRSVWAGDEMPVSVTRGIGSPGAKGPAQLLLRLWDYCRNIPAGDVQDLVYTPTVTVTMNVPTWLGASVHFVGALCISDMAISGTGRSVIGRRTSYTR